MEYQKIINFLDNTSNQPTKVRKNLEESGLLIKALRKTVKNKAKE